MAKVEFELPKEAPWTNADMEKIGHLKEAHDKIMGQVRKAMVGQDKVIRLTMIGLFSQGHCLLMGVPGIGKTLLVRTLASSLSLKFRRVQFTRSEAAFVRPEVQVRQPVVYAHCQQDHGSQCHQTPVRPRNAKDSAPLAGKPVHSKADQCANRRQTTDRAQRLRRLKPGRKDAPAEGNQHP